jgi:hypothetical protein
MILQTRYPTKMSRAVARRPSLQEFFALSSRRLHPGSSKLERFSRYFVIPVSFRVIGNLAVECNYTVSYGFFL